MFVIGEGEGIKMKKMVSSSLAAILILASSAASMDRISAESIDDVNEKINELEKEQEEIRNKKNELNSDEEATESKIDDNLSQQSKTEKKLNAIDKEL